jgi:hypothetical protein
MEETACATHQMSYTGLFLEIIWSKSDRCEAVNIEEVQE